jgi:menaquinol-cytochrome c reductase iron-sulfur subunit
MTMHRQGFLKRLVQGAGLFTAGLFIVPSIITAFTPVWRGRQSTWRPVGNLDDFPVDDVTRTVVPLAREDWSASLQRKGVYVWRPNTEEVVVFSRNCTDLSCPVTWDPASGWFYCPCHGGIFARNGERMAGPPKRALYRYANRVRDGVLEIDLQSLPPMT